MLLRPRSIRPRKFLRLNVRRKRKRRKKRNNLFYFFYKFQEPNAKNQISSKHQFIKFQKIIKEARSSVFELLTRLGLGGQFGSWVKKLGNNPLSNFNTYLITQLQTSIPAS
jgi:hypothetical protein